MDAPVFLKWLELAKKTKAKYQDIFTGDKQSLSQILASYHFPLQDKAWAGNMYFLNQWPWTCTTESGSSSWHILSQKQSLCKVRVANVST